MPVQRPRIVSLLPAATDMLFLGGAGEQVVGVSHECNWPPAAKHLPQVTRSRIDSGQSSQEIDQQVKALIARGEPLCEIDRELVASLRPDLIVTQSQCDVCAIPEDDVHRLVRDGVVPPGTVVLSLSPSSLAEVLEDLVRVGEAAGHPESALRAREKLTKRLEAVSTRATDRIGPRVVVVEWLDPPMIASNWTPELVQRAGGHYPLGSAGKPSTYARWDEIVAAAPDVLIVAPCGFDLDRAVTEWRRTTRPPGWGTIPAATSGRVFVVDGDIHFNRPGPRLVETVEMLAVFISGDQGECVECEAWVALP